MLPNDAITASEGRLELGVREPLAGVFVEVAAGVEPCRRTRVDLEVSPFEWTHLIREPQCRTTEGSCSSSTRIV